MARFNADRTFGVEIEVTTRHSAQTLAERINNEFAQRGINQQCHPEGYNHNTRPYWKIVSDASVRGWEIVSPPMKGLAAYEEIKAVCAGLKAVGNLAVTVDRSTGLHVHHDAADLTGEAIGNIFANYSAHQKLIDLIVAPSRRNNRMCAPLSYDRIITNNRGRKDNFKKNTKQAAVDKVMSRTGTRYVSLNIYSIRNHGTIEFRQHQGSIDAEKIFNWILFTQSIIEAGAEAQRQPKPVTIDGRGVFYKFRRLNAIIPKYNEYDEEACKPYMDAYKYIEKRFEEFAGRAGVDPKTLR